MSKRLASSLSLFLACLATAPVLANDNQLSIASNRDVGPVSLTPGAPQSDVGTLTITPTTRQTALRSDQPSTDILNRDTINGEPRVASQQDSQTQSNPPSDFAVTRSLAATAVRSGGGNVATVNVNGNGGFVGLSQSATDGLSGNTASVQLDGSGEALIDQVGSQNIAELTVGRDALQGSIQQNGNGNEATLDVSGDGATGSITQIGNNNTQSLDVSGAGANVSYTVQGNDTSSLGPVGASVVSGGLDVQITQTMMPGY